MDCAYQFDNFRAMSNERRETYRILAERQANLGIGVDGNYCLACGKPLYGPELLHSPPRQPSAVDRLRNGR